jgi:23S rRNA (cytidine2498-2'-O)-methyltransferase
MPGLNNRELHGHDVTGPMPDFRRAARLVVIDRNHRVLLFRHAETTGREFWATPGDGLEGGETVEQSSHLPAEECPRIADRQPQNRERREEDELPEQSGSAIVSVSPDYLGEALRELRGVRPRTRLGPGVQLVDLPKRFDTWANELVRRRPIFVRHVSPVDATAPIAAGLDAYRAAVTGLVGRVAPNATFAAQIQLVDESIAGRHQLRAAAHDIVTEAVGLEVNIPDPEQVLSVVVSCGTAYLGVSPTRLNLSAWPGGQRRYAREPDQVSRSEFKLLEAIEAFGMELRGGHALDLGASPGGWTRVLAERGWNVVAVDPGELHTSMAAHPRVVHQRIHVQQLHTIAGLPRFSLVVNDMRMDARDSARLMVQMKALLDANGHGVMTLKLPKAKATGALLSAIEILRGGFRVKDVRQLFHNRHEVTVHLTW